MCEIHCRRFHSCCSDCLIYAITEINLFFYSAALSVIFRFSVRRSAYQRNDSPQPKIQQQVFLFLFVWWFLFFERHFKHISLLLFHCFTDFNTLQYKCNYFLYRQFHIQENERVVCVPMQLLCSENGERNICLLVISFIVNNKTSRLYLIWWLWDIIEVLRWRLLHPFSQRSSKHVKSVYVNHAYETWLCPTNRTKYNSWLLWPFRVLKSFPLLN